MTFSNAINRHAPTTSRTNCKTVFLILRALPRHPPIKEPTIPTKTHTINPTSVLPPKLTFMKKPPNKPTIRPMMIVAIIFTSSKSFKSIISLSQFFNLSILKDFPMDFCYNLSINEILFYSLHYDFIPFYGSRSVRTSRKN